MQLIIILLVTVSVLTLLSGAIVFFGSKKGERARSAWFFLASIFATIWMISILFFLVADSTWQDTIDWHVKWTFASAILLDVSFLGYISWAKKSGRITTLLFLLGGVTIGSLIFLKPELLYNEIVLSKLGNSVMMNTGPLYFAYIAFFGLIVPAVIIALLKQFSLSRSSRKRNGDLVIMLSFGASSTLTLVANLILPSLDNWKTIWVGPLAISVTIIAFYYTILRYRALDLSSIWLKIFSYIVILASAAIVYMVIFSLIFAALFRGATPSTEVIILNFIMVLIFLVLMPAMNQISESVRALISGNKNDDKKDNAK